MSLPFSHFDRQGVKPSNVLDGYAIWSKNYDEMLTDNLDGPVLAHFKPHLSMADCDVVDLGCGTGRIGGWIRGNLDVRSLAGVDVSPEMLARAEAKDLYDELHARDMTDSGLPSASRDVVINVLSACHVRDLVPLYCEASRLLRTDGAFAVVDYHPHMLLCGHGTCFPDVDGNMVAIENHVHLLSDHTAAACEHGFEFVTFTESLITQEWLDAGLKKTEFLNHPIGFGYVWRKTP